MTDTDGLAGAISSAVDELQAYRDCIPWPRPIAGEPAVKLPYTVQVFYEARDDNGKAFRATSVCQVMAADVSAAYAAVASAFSDRPHIALGAIIPGTHVKLP